MKLFLLLVLTAYSLLLTACSESKDSALDETVLLPTDTRLNLYCTDVGIGDNDCVLDDPNNPFSRSNIDDSTKWILNNEVQSSKSKFYLWATAMALNPTGENQYYTALSLHELYTENNNTHTQEQAIKSYRSVLDNYYTSKTYFTTQKRLDFLADVDFYFGEWGSGSQLNGAYNDDDSLSPVFEVIAGDGWGAPTATLSFSGFTNESLSHYANLTFKIKSLPTDKVWVKFASGGGAEFESSFDLNAYATNIEDKAQWKEVTIPMSNFPDLAAYTEFAIFSGWSNGGTFLITDIAFTGDITGNGLVNDYDNDGYVYLYKTDPGTEEVSASLRNLVGINLTKLFTDKNDSHNTLSLWGYEFNEVNQTLFYKDE